MPNWLPSGVGGYARQTVRQARRILVLVLGGMLLLVGVAMLVLPGPAVVMIPVGLGVLAIEFAWARNWLNRAQQVARQFQPNQRDRLVRATETVSVSAEGEGPG